MENKLSKKELNKLKKKEQQSLRKLEQQMGDQVKIEEVIDVSAGRYGTRPLVSDKKIARDHPILPISSIDEHCVGETVTITGFLHQVRRTGKQAFMVVRQRMSTVQCIGFMDNEIVSKPMIQFVGNIPRESVIEVQGVVKAVDKPVESCTQSLVEIHITQVFILSKAKSRLALQIEDAMRPDTDSADGLAKVNLDTRLDNRVLDLRTPSSRAIFRIKSAVGSFFSQHLDNLGFDCIHTPSLLGSASEGGANVFEVNYFQQKAYLAQSPQFYKQMAIVAGFERVYVVGPVFRAENSNTHRHLTEFWGLDMEMAFYNGHYHEVLNTICSTMVAVFRRLETELAAEIATVRKQFPSKPLEYLEPTLVLLFSDGVQMLRDAGVEMGDHDDLSTANEKLLGRLVKRKFGTDFYVLDRFPSAVRPFYTMRDPHDSAYSHSYDIFLRGEEIMSGAQRIHDAAMLRESALRHGINLDTIRDYLESFENGCAPHAGGGFGLERVVMLYLGLDNIRRSSLFPHDPKRLNP